MEINDTPSPNQEVKSWFQKNKIWIIIAAIFVLSHAGSYFYQRFQHGKLRDQFNAEIEKKADLAAQMTQHNNERLAEALVKPLVWGVRGEMMRGNKELVDHFLTSVVQETDLDLIAVVDMTGTVYLSTDKKYENRPVTEVIPTMPNEVLKAGVQTSSLDKVVATAPVLGETAQLGVLYFEANAGEKNASLLKALRENPFADPEAAKDKE